MTCVEAWNSAFLSRCQRGFRPLGELNLGPGALFELATRASELPSGCELILGFHLKYTHPETNIRTGEEQNRPFYAAAFPKKAHIPYWNSKGYLTRFRKLQKFPDTRPHSRTTLSFLPKVKKSLIFPSLCQDEGRLSCFSWRGM